MGELPDAVLGLPQLAPDDVVEDSEDGEGAQGGHGHPGPGGVPDDVVLAQPQFCGLHSHDLG